MLKYATRSPTFTTGTGPVAPYAVTDPEVEILDHLSA